MKSSFLHKVICLLLVLCLAVSLCGCDPVIAGGNNNALRTVGIYSMLGVSDAGGEELLTLEQDEYGRTLFAYKNTSFSSEPTGGDSTDIYNNDLIAVLVCQSYDDKTAGFYEHDNYIFSTTAASSVLDEDLVYSIFSESDIESLKQANDWGKELQPEKMVSVEVTSTVKDIKSNNLGKMGDAADAQIEGDVRKHFISPYAVDNEGRCLCYYRYDDIDYCLHEGYIVLFDEDGALVAMEEITSPDSFREQLMAFELEYGWHMG